MDNKLATLPMHVGMLYAIYSLYLHVYIHVHSFCAKGFCTLVVSLYHDIRFHVQHTMSHYLVTRSSFWRLTL